MRGSVDVVTTKLATGWLFCAREKVTVQALLDNQIIGEAIADRPRPDLEFAGFGDGCCGFVIDFHREIDPHYLPFVAVTPEGGDLEVPRTTTSGYSEFFKALYRKYPAAGRSLGGFIQDGLLILEDVTEPSGAGTRDGLPLQDEHANEIGVVDDLAGLVLAALTSDNVLRTLRLILEDQPLAIYADHVEGKGTDLYQPSALAKLPSPAECVQVIVPAGDADVAIEVVRDSHLLPEFLANGASRWTNPTAPSVLEEFERDRAMLDGYVVNWNETAIIGPGLLHAVRPFSDSLALRILCTPCRNAPLHLSRTSSHRDINNEFGLRIWI